MIFVPMIVVPPLPLIRRNAIIKKLRNCGAVSAETAKTLAEAGLINPDIMPGVTERMIKKGIIKKTADGRYYIC